MSNATKESVKETTSGGEAAKKEEAPVEAKAAADAPKAPTITIQEAQEVDPDLPLDITNSPNVSNDAKTNAIEESQTRNANAGTPKFAILLSWNLGYFKTTVGLLRLVFMLCCILSLVCLANAGTDDVDVLDLSAFSRIRFHIFCCVLVLLVSSLILILEVTSLKNSMPINWYLASILLRCRT